MRITEKAISELLQKWIHEVRIQKDKAFSFSDIRLTARDEPMCREDILYVCTAAQAPAADVCVLIKKQDYDASPVENAIVLEDSSDLLEIVNQLLFIFEKGHRFSDALQNAMIVHHDYASLFKIVEEYFPNCLIVMTDTAYNIICATKTKVNDTYLDSLLSRGFYDKNDIRKIAEHGYFNDGQRMIQPVRYPADATISGKIMLLRSYLWQGFSSEFVACYVLSGDLSEFDCLMFEEFTNCIELVVQNQQAQHDFSAREEQLIADLLDGEKQENKELIQDRCIRLGIPYRCKFRIGVIQTDDETESRVSNITKQLFHYCPVKNFGVFKYKTRIIILFYDWNYYTVKESAARDENFHVLINTLQATQSRIGISLGFDTMECFRAGYMQAERTLAASTPVIGTDETIRLYSDWYLQDMLTTYETVLPLDTVYIRQLDSFDDRKHNEYSDLALLYVYLRSERNVSATARKLNMHRNGVIYRVNKIMDQLNLDLEDPDTRLRLMISFEILKKLGKFKTDEKLLDREQ